MHDKVLRGVSACQKGPKISHLFFADDCLIFGRATIKESKEILRLLKVYGESSELQLNKLKTSLFFSHNTDRRIQEAIKGRFGAQVIKQHETYLGLPSLVGRSKRNTFASSRRGWQANWQVGTRNCYPQSGRKF